MRYKMDEELACQDVRITECTLLMIVDKMLAYQEVRITECVPRYNSKQSFSLSGGSYFLLLLLLLLLLTTNY